MLWPNAEWMAVQSPPAGAMVMNGVYTSLPVQPGVVWRVLVLTMHQL